MYTKWEKYEIKVDDSGDTEGVGYFKKVTKSGREVGRGPEFHIYLNKIFTYVGETHAL